MTFFRLLLCGSLLLAQADRFAGTYSNDVFTLELRREGAGYVGTIRAQGESMPVNATAEGEQLAGSFGSGAQSYRFQATRSADTLVLISDGSRYELRALAAKPVASPAAVAPATGLVGDWQASDGVLSLRADGTAAWGPNRYRYVVKGNQIIATGGPEGSQILPFQVSGDTLTLLVEGTAVRLTRRAAGQAPAAATAAQGGVAADLVGKWCKVTNFNANNTGAYNSSACIVLNANGSFVYGAETDSYNPNGGVTSQTADSGTWTAAEGSITANSRLRGGAVTFRLERRNHPKTGDPMIVLDGDAYVTFYQKAPWR